jgi:hypothetical protein
VECFSFGTCLLSKSIANHIDFSAFFFSLNKTKPTEASEKSSDSEDVGRPKRAVRPSAKARESLESAPRRSASQQGSSNAAQKSDGEPQVSFLLH